MTKEDERPRMPDGYWDEKTADPIGWAPPEERYELLYQHLHGQVFTLMRRSDGSRSRGQVELAELEKLVGSTPREGWYDQEGKYLGAQPPGSLA